MPCLHNLTIIKLHRYTHLSIGLLWVTFQDNVSLNPQSRGRYDDFHQSASVQHLYRSIPPVAYIAGRVPRQFRGLYGRYPFGGIKVLGHSVYFLSFAGHTSDCLGRLLLALNVPPA